MSQERQTAIGIGYMVMAAAVFGVMDALVKWLAGSYPTAQIMFCRSFFAFPPILFMLWRNGGGIALLHTRRLAGHGIRSIYGCLAMLCFFYSYRTLPLADVTAISFSAPIFVAVLSVWLLKEKVGPHRWSAILVGFLGMLVILRPGQGEGGIPAASLLVVLATFFYSMALIQIRKLTATENSVTTAFYFTGFCTIYTGLLMPWFWVAPTAADWPLLIGVGLLGGLAQLFMTRAFSLAAASIVAPFDYTHLLWSVLLGWYLFGDFPDMWTWAGAAIVIASGLYILYRETVRKRVVPATAWSE
ncbi:MAG: DMT family transporter [Ferrovibrio sp.]|nr:DMT family transporter [Ferrovibrio sp.]